MKLRILISGASRGLGRELSRYYHSQGHTVIGCGRTEVIDPEFDYVRADLTQEEDIVSLTGHILKTHGGLDVLINNAGVAGMNHLLLTPGRSVEKMLQLNVLANFNLTRECSKLMKHSPNGRIVNVTTTAVPLSLEGEAAYVASKAAVESFTKTFAKELSGFGITVNAVGPTPLQTDMIKNVPKEKIEKMTDLQALKHEGSIQDVANVIDFFISPKSGFISGQVLYLGGISA
jgi:3-oxoacyl-[acyl-carrier protein] reductase